MCLKIRCDGESEKFCKIFWELNMASPGRTFIVTHASQVKREENGPPALTSDGKKRQKQHGFMETQRDECYSVAIAVVGTAHV
jgi:hypothetical protein